MFLICILLFLVKDCNRSGQITRPMPIGRARARKISEARLIVWACTICLVKRKNSFDVQISSQTDKTMKKL